MDARTHARWITGGARRQARHAASHGRVCALPAQWGATPAARRATWSGRAGRRPGPNDSPTREHPAGTPGCFGTQPHRPTGSIHRSRTPRRPALLLHAVAPGLPSRNVPSPRPAAEGLDPARPSVDRAAAGGISPACEGDPWTARPQISTWTQLFLLGDTGLDTASCAPVRDQAQSRSVAVLLCCGTDAALQVKHGSRQEMECVR